MHLRVLRENWQSRRSSARQNGCGRGTDSATRLKLPVTTSSEFGPRVMEVGRVLQCLLTPPPTAQRGWQGYRSPPPSCGQGRQGGWAEQAQEPPWSHQLLLFSQKVMQNYGFSAQDGFGCRAMVLVAHRWRGFAHPGVRKRQGVKASRILAVSTQLDFQTSCECLDQAEAIGKWTEG